MLPGSASGAGVALVRPEAVSFERRSAQGQATMVSVAFLGPGVARDGDAGRRHLVVAQLASAAAAALTVGDRVEVRIDPVPMLVVAD